MAGMLPGVECARRRRFHGGGIWPESSPSSAAAAAASHGWTRRPSFCLYTTNHETHHPSISFSRNNVRNKPYGEEDEKLGGVVREAKERLNERLRNQRRPEFGRRQSGKDKVNAMEEQRRSKAAHGEMWTEVVGSRKSGGRMIAGWFGWRAGDQKDCAICLDRFKTGETLVHLPCAHKFHSKCLVPWLDNNVNCPYCRMDIWN